MKASPQSALVDVADRLALVISGACIVHCLTVPLVFTLLPVLATFIYALEALHFWLVVINMASLPWRN